MRTISNSSRRPYVALLCALGLLLGSCSGSSADGDTAATQDSAAAAPAPAQDSSDEDVTEDAPADESPAEPAPSGALDCAALAPHSLRVGNYWQLMTGVIANQDPTIFEDFPGATGFNSIYELDQLAGSVEQLRVLEPFGPLMAGFLNNTLEIDGVVQGAIAGDEAARLAALDEIELITGGSQNVIGSLIEFGEVLTAAGCAP